MSRLLLLRHGQSEWNAAGRWQGQADIPLSARGEQQAEEAARRLADLGGNPFRAVVASDLRRTVRTAEIKFYRAAITSAVANGQQSAQFRQALCDLGTGGA